jgi:hypothetical protein
MIHVVQFAEHAFVGCRIAFQPVNALFKRPAKAQTDLKVFACAGFEIHSALLAALLSGAYPWASLQGYDGRKLRLFLKQQLKYLLYLPILSGPTQERQITGQRTNGSL